MNRLAALQPPCGGERAPPLHCTISLKPKSLTVDVAITRILIEIQIRLYNAKWKSRMQKPKGYTRVKRLFACHTNPDSLYILLNRQILDSIRTLLYIYR